MVEFETDIVLARRLTDTIILVEPRYGAEINRESAAKTNEIISAMMPEKYGMIVDRKMDYSIDPVGVYALLNQIPNLEAIAILLHSEKMLSMIPLEQKLFKGPLEAFWDIESAQVWLESTLANIPEPAG